MQTFGHTKHMAENPIQFVWERPKADQYDRTSHTKYMRTIPGAGGKKYGPEARPARHRRPHDLCGGARRVGWSSMAAEVGKSHMYSSPAAPPYIQYERGENTH